MLAACGDDSGTNVVRDAGAGDGGGPGGGKIPRHPGQNPVDDPIKNCNRFDAAACAAGEECHVLVRRAAGVDQFTITNGCVKASNGRTLGAPCEQWGGFGKPYMTPGLLDEVYLDPCDTGLFCAPNENVRGASSCQVACDITNKVGCQGATQYCQATASDPFEDVCVESDKCDPTSGTGCPPGKACYLRPGDVAASVLTTCLAESDMPAADGEPCLDNGTIILNKCRPGSSCWGPPQVPPDRWTEADLVCRRNCAFGADLAELDAGNDADGGAGGQCPAGDVCFGLEASGLTVPSGTSLGLCY